MDCVFTIQKTLEYTYINPHEIKINNMNNVVKLGLILAGISILLMLLAKFVLGYDFMFSWKMMLSSYALTSIVCIVLGRKYFRDPEDGTLGYGQAVKNLFLSMLLSSLVSMIVAAVIFGNDQELAQASQEYAISTAEASLRWGGELGGMSEAQIQEEIEKVKEEIESANNGTLESPYAFSQLPMNLLISAVYSIIIALILAIFIKKNDGDESA